MLSCWWRTKKLLYLSLNQLLDILDGANAPFARRIIDVLLGFLQNVLFEHLLALPDRLGAGLCTHRQLWKVGARRPQLVACNAVSTIALDTYIKSSVSVIGLLLIRLCYCDGYWTIDISNFFVNFVKHTNNRADKKNLRWSNDFLSMYSPLESNISRNIMSVIKIDIQGGL